MHVDKHRYATSRTNDRTQTKETKRNANGDGDSPPSLRPCNGPCCWAGMELPTARLSVCDVSDRGYDDDVRGRWNGQQDELRRNARNRKGVGKVGFSVTEFDGQMTCGLQHSSRQRLRHLSSWSVQLIAIITKQNAEGGGEARGRKGRESRGTIFTYAPTNQMQQPKGGRR